MRSYFESVTLIGLLALGGIAMAAEKSAQEKAESECALAAATEYNRANLGLLLSSGPLMSAQALVAQRRLTEAYCTRFAGCLVSNPAADPIRFSTIFSRCLREEEEERNKN
jgi:hypothetical protein